MLRRTALVLATISVLAGAVEKTGADSVLANLPVASSLARDSAAAPAARTDSLRAGQDSTIAQPKSKRQGAVQDSTVKKSIPPRILSFEDQLLFAMVFMSYIALMLTSMTNVNP